MDHPAQRRRGLRLGERDLERIAAALAEGEPGLDRRGLSWRRPPRFFVPTSALSEWLEARCRQQKKWWQPSKTDSDSEASEGDEGVLGTFVDRVDRKFRGQPGVCRVQLVFRGLRGARALVKLGRSVARKLGCAMPASTRRPPPAFESFGSVRLGLVVKRVSGGYCIVSARVLGTSDPVDLQNGDGDLGTWFKQLLVRATPAAGDDGKRQQQNNHRPSDPKTKSGPPPVVRDRNGVKSDGASGPGLGRGDPLRFMHGHPTETAGGSHDGVSFSSSFQETPRRFQTVDPKRLRVERDGGGGSRSAVRSGGHGGPDADPRASSSSRVGQVPQQSPLRASSCACGRGCLDRRPLCQGASPSGDLEKSEVWKFLASIRHDPSRGSGTATASASAPATGVQRQRTPAADTNDPGWRFQQFLNSYRQSPGYVRPASLSSSASGVSRGSSAGPRS
ncbi:m166.5 protein [Murid betaherpesvirus 1]|nr:m166.5 protein [Murid betaherpesvirus 1]